MAVPDIFTPQNLTDSLLSTAKIPPFRGLVNLHVLQSLLDSYGRDEACTVPLHMAWDLKERMACTREST